MIDLILKYSIHFTKEYEQTKCYYFFALSFPDCMLLGILHNPPALFSSCKRYMKVKALVAQLSPTLCDPKDCSPPCSSVHGDSPGKSTGVGCHALLQGIFPIQGWNPGLLHCRQMLYLSETPGSPMKP